MSISICCGFFHGVAAMRTVRGTTTGWDRLKDNKPKAKPPRTDLKCYDVRDANLSLLGFRSYSEYLESDLWKTIRDFQLAEFPKCRLCRRDACVVHHLRYDMHTLAGRGKLMLVSMCHWCHEWCEFEDGVKLDVYRANGKAMKMVSPPTLQGLLLESAFMRPSKKADIQTRTRQRSAPPSRKTEGLRLRSLRYLKSRK